MKLGTPDEHNWPGVRNLPDWHDQFPKWRPVTWAEVCPNLDPLGLDLLSKMLVYDPQMRVTAKQALNHEYFREIQTLMAANMRNGGLQQFAG
jgi:cyclin-dependent kinase 2